MPDSVEDALTETLVTEAQSPKKSESDGQMAEGRPLREILDAIAVRQAVRGKSPWSSMARAVPPGAGPS